MTPSPETQQRLDTIHHLLERERVYRSVSAATALVAGSLSLIASASIVWRLVATGSRVIDMNFYFSVWIGVLVVTLLIGTTLLRRDEARTQSGPLPTQAIRLVKGTLTPFLLTAVALGLLFSWRGSAYSLSITWITLYGLALIACSPFAPRAISTLGWAFLITGASIMLFIYLRIRLLIGYERSDLQSALIMGATFGLFHVLYAMMTWAQIHRENVAASPEANDR
jgi:hypothetical protein